MSASRKSPVDVDNLIPEGDDSLMVQSFGSFSFLRSASVDEKLLTTDGNKKSETLYFTVE